MMIVIKKCEACGAEYNYKVSGSTSPRDWNEKQGVTGKYCKECAPTHHVPAPPRDWKWVPTTDVTPDQMFEWDKEDTQRQREQYERRKDRYKTVTFPCIKRAYFGLIKSNGAEVEDVQDAIWSHGYRMVYWRNSREIVSICKRVKRAC